MSHQRGQMTKPTVSKHWRKIESQELGFNPTRSTPPCYSNTTHMQYGKINKNTSINTNESRHSEMGPVRQNLIQRTVRTAHLVCLWLCTTAAHNTAQTSSDNLPSYLHAILIVQLLSIREGGFTRDVTKFKFEFDNVLTLNTFSTFEIRRMF